MFKFLIVIFLALTGLNAKAIDFDSIEKALRDLDDSIVLEKHGHSAESPDLIKILEKHGHSLEKHGHSLESHDLSKRRADKTEEELEQLIREVVVL